MPINFQLTIGYMKTKRNAEGPMSYDYLNNHPT